MLSFEEIKDSEIKGLFDNLLEARRDWMRQMGLINQRRSANTTQENIISFMKEMSRQKWRTQGWLQPGTNCMRHFV